MKKPFQQITLDFGALAASEPEADQPAQQEPLVEESPAPYPAPQELPGELPDSPASVATAPERSSGEYVENAASPARPQKPPPPVISRPADETASITIRKKPGRKEKEKAWKSESQPKRGRKSLKEIAAEADLIEIPADDILFSKQYYSIGDVGNMFRMNPSLIRTWSNEFDHLLQPKKNRKGDRFFRPQDVKTLHLIYHLIRVRKFTLEGAKEHLKSQKKKTENQFAVIQSLQEFKAFLLELKQNL